MQNGVYVGHAPATHESSTAGNCEKRDRRDAASLGIIYTPMIYLSGSNTHGRTSGLTKSDDFSNARAKGAIAGDCERHRIIDDVSRARRTILHASGAPYPRKIAEIQNLRFKVVDQGHLMGHGTMVNAVIETLTRREIRPHAQ